MQFYRADTVADYNGTQVINTLWFRRNLITNPTLADQEAVATEVQNNWIPKLRDFTVSAFQWRQIVVRSYGDLFNEEPALSTIRPITILGLSLNTGASPMYCAILSMRVLPVRVGPPSARHPAGAPVRRGYLALSGLAEVDFESDGRMGAGLRNSPLITTISTYLSTEQAISTGAPGIRGIRVSAAHPTTGNRGYGDIVSAQLAEAVSSRRSRKLGRGA